MHLFQPNTLIFEIFIITVPHWRDNSGQAEKFKMPEASTLNCAETQGHAWTPQPAYLGQVQAAPG
jgi:hypothetical protein